MSRPRAAVLAFACAGMLAPAPAGAAPSKDKVQDAIERLGRQIGLLNEDYNSAVIELAKVNAGMRDVQARREKAEAHQDAMRRAATARAVAVYRTGVPEMLQVWLTSTDAAEFNRKMSVVSKIGAWESGLLSSLQIAKERAQDRAEELQRAQARATRIRDDIAAKRRELTAKMVEQKRLLDSIMKDEARRRAAAEAARRQAREVAARRAALQAAAAAVVPVAGGPSAAVRADLPVSARARRAVETAYDQIGKPYRWGGSGPDNFDCSGLNMYAWRAAGVSLPHSSRAQFNAAPRVAREDLEPGDLLFFGSPIHHAGIYVGDGRMIAAPQTGQRVGLFSAFRRDYVGAVRPGL